MRAPAMHGGMTGGGPAGLWPNHICLPLHAGSHLRVQGLLLLNAVLPSAQLLDSGLATAALLAFNLSRGSSGSSNSSNSSGPVLVLDGCTVSTSCDNLAQFAAWLHREQQQPHVSLRRRAVALH